AACGVRVGTDLLVRLARQRGQIGLRQAPILHAHLHCETESAQFARTDRDRTSDARLARVLFLLLADEIERAAETSGIAGGKQMLGSRSPGAPRTAHLLGQ